MGLIARSLTKRRVALESGPDNVIAPTALEKSLLAATKVRAAMLGQNLRGVSSQARRGTVSAFAFGKDSQLRYQRHTDTSWSVSLGTLGTMGEQANDWLLEIIITDDSRVAVTTPQYLTVDGSLANAKVYDEVRAGVLDAFAYADRGSNAAELGLSQASLELSASRGVRIEGLPSGTVEVRVARERDDVEHALAQIGLPMERPNDSDLVWRSALGDIFLRLSLNEFDGTVTLRGVLDLRQGGPNYRVACSQAAATTWCDRAHMLLRDLDPQFQLVWPERS